MRSRIAIGSAVASAVIGSMASAKPEFVPAPAGVYRDYEAIEMPRSDVPVGALWVQDYGPTGEGAAADNLLTERSLSQVTISSDLQLSLTAGILNLFGLDPSYKSRLSARFSDISIVRVKDMARLSGPASEPRIYEAIKAGTITITTDHDVGLRLDTRVSALQLPVTGRSDNGRRRSFSIDGKDMFIAFRVASFERVKRDLGEMKLSKSETGYVGSFEGRDFVISCGGAGENVSAPSPAAALSSSAVVQPFGDLPPVGALGGAGTISNPTPLPAPKLTPPGEVLPAGQPAALPPQPAPAPPSPIVPQTVSDAPAAPVATPDDSSAPLRVPLADGKGGLFDRVVVVPHRARSSEDPSTGGSICSSNASKLKAAVRLIGWRLEPASHPRAPRWR